MINDKNNDLSNKTFLTILADGKFHKLVTEETEGAIKREIKDKKTGEVTGFKWETLHDSVSGIITGVSMYNGKFGRNIQVTIDSEVVSVGAETAFGEALLKKLPALDFSKEVTLEPYAGFTSGDGKKVKAGLSVKQGGNKIGDYYYNPETKKSIHGIPEVVKDKYGDFKPAFKERNYFMSEQLEKLSVFKKMEVKEEVINADDIPF